MNDSRAADIVSLIATWGASADPLFQAIEARREAATASSGPAPDPAVPERVEKLLALAPLLDSTLIDDLELVREATHRSTTDPAVLSQLTETTERVRLALTSLVEERRDTWRREVEPWIAAVGIERCRDALDRLPVASIGYEPEELAASIHAFDAARETWTGSLKQLQLDLAKTERTDANADALKRAQRCLDAGDPNGFRDAYRALRTDVERGALDERRGELERLHQSIRNAVGTLERFLASAGERQRTAVAPLAKSLEDFGNRPIPQDAVGLDAELRRGRALQSALAEVGKAKTRKNQPTTEARARDVLERAQQRASARGVTAESSGPALHQAAALVQAIDARDREDHSNKRKAAARLGKIVDGADKALQQAVTDAPPAALAALRQARDAAAVDRAGENFDGTAGHEQAVKAAIAALDQAREAARASRDQQASSIRKQLEARLGRFTAVADASAVKRCRELIASDPTAAVGAIDALERESEQAVRGEAFALLQRAGDAGANDAGTKALSRALEGDDLAAIAKRVDEVAAQPFAKASGSLKLYIAVVAVTALAVAAIVAFKLFAGGPETYTVRLRDGAPSDASVALVQGGTIVAEQPYDPTGNRFQIPAGDYEIFVNRRVTGRRLTVPGDTKIVADVPAPPAGGS